MKFDHFKFLVEHMFEANSEGRIEPRYSEVKTSALNPLVQAYIGDAYFSLYVRGRLLMHEQNKVQVLHQFGAQIVSAVWQAAAYYEMEPQLTDDEKAIFRRGRNAKSHAPRSASVAEYHASTGFEALLGSLYLDEKYERLQELAALAFDIISREMLKKINQKAGEK